MIVQVSPRRLDATPGFLQQLTVTVSNTTDVIGGYTLRVLGADPGWVSTTDHTFSLFPDETRAIPVSVTIPHGISAGERRIAVQVRELTPPEGSSIEEVVLVVPDDPSVTLRADPSAIQAGKKGRFSILIDNNGNTTVKGVLAGTDPEAKVKYAFVPPTVNLAPGEHTVVDLKVKAKQPFLGSPVVRMINLYLDDEATVAALAAQTEQAKAEAAKAEADAKAAAKAEKKLELKKPELKAGKKKKAKEVVPEREAPPLANATFIQRSLVGRGLVSLLGLLAAVTVFAIVLTIALSRIVGQSAADRDLALAIAAANDNAASTGTSGMSGTVLLLTSGAPVPGVAVTVYSAADTDSPLATAATNADGTYSVSNLPAGAYKLTFRGAGFVQLWYPGAIDPADASTITLASNHQQNGLNVSLGGLPATISGTIKGDDVSGATLTLMTPTTTPTTAGTTANSGAKSGVAGAAFVTKALHARKAVPAADSTDPTAVAAQGGAIVKTVAIGADGTFTLEGIPSPSVYEVQITKPGYATSTQLIDVSAGESRSDLNITLRKGDGIISGTVNSAGGPLGNVTLTATSGQTTVTTVSLDQADGTNAKGSFVLRGLPTPALFTVVASAPGYASQTMSLTLASGQSISGVSLTLGISSGQLSGDVTLSDGGGPAPGVGVTVTDGSQTIQSATKSSGNGVGSWQVSGLALPGTYTVTFTRSDLATHTVSVSLDSAGNITPDSIGGGITASGISVSLHSATAVLSGIVSQKAALGATSSSPVGEATVSLSNGASTYTVTSASVPASLVGAYTLEGIPPGTYTVNVSLGGVSPTSQLITLAAGDKITDNWKLDPAASITGSVTGATAGWIVDLYRASDYPSVVYRETTTDASGKFSFPNLDAPETYVIEVRPTVASAPAGSTTLQLDPSEALTNVVVTASSD